MKVLSSWALSSVEKILEGMVQEVKNRYCIYKLFHLSTTSHTHDFIWSFRINKYIRYPFNNSLIYLKIIK